LTIFCGGHALIVGVPGLAKTLLVRSLGRTLNLSFSRIQFTPDLMPSDITGTDIIEEDPATGKRRLEFLPGPIFANLILADEINRTPPKTQAAMLQVMQEHEVSIGSKTYPLAPPFHVFATQNPIEMEGTYVLPEAQADRFMFSIQCGYPTNAEEELVVRNTTGTDIPELKPVLDGKEIVEIQKLVRAMPISDEVVSYAVRLVSRTRPEDPAAPQYVKEYVRWGASPRASQYLVLGAKARAAISGKLCADYDGVKSVARQVLRHRIITNFNARAQKISVPDVIEKILGEVSPR
jgi:MoxR-like ATPase